MTTSIRWVAVVLAVLTVGAVTGCGGSSSSRSSEPKDVPARKLAALDYLGGTIERGAFANLDSPLTAGKYSTEAFGSNDDAKVCGQSVGNGQQSVVAGTLLQDASPSSTASNAVFALRTTALAERYVDAIARLARRCKTFIGGQMKYTTQEPPVVLDVGDQIVGFRGTGEAADGSGTITLLQVFLRKGQFVSSVSLLTLGTVEDATLAMVTRAQLGAVERLAKELS